jgi:peptidoglycan lytic transglycosylase
LSFQSRIALTTGLAVILVAFGPGFEAKSAPPDSITSAAGSDSNANHPAKTNKSAPITSSKSAKSDPKKSATIKDGAKSKAGKPPSPNTTAALGPKSMTPIPAPSALSPATNLTASPADIAAVKHAMTLAHQGKASQATDEERSIGDPLARKVVEWAILRSDDNGVDFARYAEFIAANPSWPSIGLLRRRAEAALWQERLDPATVRAFFAHGQPLSAKGRFALARALLAQGDRLGAQALVRAAWRNDAFSSDVEAQALDGLGELLTTADDKARMDMRLYASDVEAGMRAATRAGGEQVAIAKARAAVIRNAPNVQEMLGAVPAEGRSDPGYRFSVAQWLRRADNIAEAAQWILSLPLDSTAALDADQWWIERRLLARKLLDVGDAKTAYRVVRDAQPPTKDNYRVEHQFTAGWIALRFLNDPATAQSHFARITQGIANPISLARASYWQGRAAEAMGRSEEARRHYQAAARYPTAYYGQIARAQLGLKDLVLRPPPPRAGADQPEVLRAAELLYTVGERDLVTAMAADLGDRSQDAGALAALGEIAARHRDARAMLHVGKEALGRGMPLEHYAFPTVGIPEYKRIGPPVDTSIVYAIARQESTFYQGTVSTAKAMGLMQVTPDAGRDTSKKFGVKFDAKRLLSDPVYNVQLGTAELGALIEDYRGSLILAFAGYNAGRGRVREWIARYGDPRDPGVDPIDWVERIPFSETRNYVQRVLENLQVYRVRFGASSRLLIEADLRRGMAQN